jgi:adenylosuccinate lyase
VIERYTRPEMGAIWTEERKLALWLRVEIAACEGWAAQGVIPPDEMDAIRGASVDPERVAEHLRRTHHDVTAFLASVQERLGRPARWVHYGLTSSDVIDTALSLQVLDAADVLARGLDRLEAAITTQAVRHKGSVQAGRTHGVHAEPISFGFKLAVWIDEVRRARQRLAFAREMMAVGKLSGPVGTHASVPPAVEEAACAALGLRPAPVSTQIIQRDRHAQFVSTLALIGASLEKFATELRALQKTEVLEVEEPFDEGQTGSSSMPHKKNPELGERICGLARVLRGYALTAMENVALWHERDISHSSTERIILPDGCIVLDYMLHLLSGVIERLVVHPDRMAQNLDLTRGLLYSARTLSTLIEKGLDRQDAYAIVQRNSLESWKTGAPLRELIAADPRAGSMLSPAELDDLFGPEHHLRFVDDAFRRLDVPTA